MLRRSDLRRVLGRRLLQKLLAAGWIEPERGDAGVSVFDAIKVHRALGKLAREGASLSPRYLLRDLAPKKARAIEEIRLDLEELATPESNGN